MLISLNWLKDYIELDLPVNQIAEILTDIGLEIEGVETVESIKGGLKDLVVGEVTSCEKHEKKEKISLCQVNVGAEVPLSIVCGAPNVAKGQKVIVAPVGATIHPTTGEGFTIEKRKVYGSLSEGMICAEDEVGIGESHDGIKVLPEDTTVGQLVADLYNITTDTVFEIGLTPNRSDAQSHLGVARDIAAAIQTQLNQPARVQWPDVSGFVVDEESSPIDVELEDKERCPRYAGVVISEIEIKESPEWLKDRLRAVGIKPISNVVDITNFINHEYGQPLHAFDYHQIKGKQIVVKTVEQDSTFTTLDGEERKLSGEDLMICNAKEPMCIGGVYGGLQSGVTDTTTAIFLESAYFNPRSIRLTELRHNLRTDAATKFEKGVDPTKQVEVLKRAALLVQELAGGKITSNIVDHYPQPIERAEVDLSFEQLDKLTGIQFKDEDVVNILRRLDFEILAKTEKSLRLAVPQYRNDVTREADVIEEVLRIYGFNNVPLSGQTHFALSYDKNSRDKLQNKISEMLSGKGFHEMMTNSITKKAYYDALGGFDESKFVMPLNSLNAELDLLRPNMLMTGLEVIAHNANRSMTDGKYYDFGNTYEKKGDSFSQQSHIALYFTGNKQGKTWLSQPETYTFFDAKQATTEVLHKAGFYTVKQVETKNPLFSYGIEFHVKKQLVATIGAASQKALDLAGLKQEVFFADINFDFLLENQPQGKQFQQISKFPSIERDLALVIDKSVSYKAIENIAKQNGGKYFDEISLFDVFESEEKLGKDKKSYAVKFKFTNPKKTLTNQEIDEQMKKLIGQFEKQLEAIIRS